MAIAEGRVLDFSTRLVEDGDDPEIIFGRQGEQLAADLHGQYYNQTVRGNMFHGPILTASAIPITSTTAPTMALWNPVNSGKNAVLVRYAAGWGATTEVPGNLQLGWFQSGAAQIATGSLITAFTAVTPYNGLLGGGRTSLMRFGSAATITAATTFLPLGFSHLTTTGASTAVPGWQVIYDFNGMLIVPPGVFIFDCGSAATATTYARLLTWYETPA